MIVVYDCSSELMRLALYSTINLFSYNVCLLIFDHLMLLRKIVSLKFNDILRHIIA